jgi:hypothetical protein
MAKLTKIEKIQQDIRFAQNRLALKVKHLPYLEASTLSQEMKQKYYDGIAQEEALIANLQAKLAK